MTGEPRCHHIPLGSSPEHRYTNKALVRALRRHRAGFDPEYKDRCLAHPVSAFGPVIVAFRIRAAENGDLRIEWSHWSLDDLRPLLNRSDRSAYLGVEREAQSIQSH